MRKDTEITEISDLPNKGFKAAILKVFQHAIINMLETKFFFKSQQINRRYKETLSGNVINKNT